MGSQSQLDRKLNNRKKTLKSGIVEKFYTTINIHMAKILLLVCIVILSTLSCILIMIFYDLYHMEVNQRWDIFGKCGIFISGVLTRFIKRKENNINDTEEE